MIGVPLLYSKIHRGIIGQIEKSKLKSILFKYGGKKIIGSALKKKLGGKLRIMNSGAAPMDPAVIEFFVSIGIEFLEGYGLTETSPVVSCNPPGSIKIGSVGPPLNGIEAKIVNPDDAGIGEIVVKGDNVMQGYYNNPEQTDKVLKDGWFYTGDLGWMDEDNYIFITGRAKDVIVTSGGKNVYPDVVENIINNSRFIAESIVLGYRTEGVVGEDVGVLIYPDYEALITHAEKEGITFKELMNIEQLTEDAKDELIEKFRPLLESEVRSSMEKLAPYQRVTRIAIERDEFIKTSTRKIKRFLYKGRLDIVDIE
jgi:long-chain acyl-CoA synthetase